VLGQVSFNIGSKITSYIGDANNHEINGNGADPINSAPDYFFDLSKQQSGVFVQDQDAGFDQRIRTINPVNSATVILSSRDYAGEGNIEATLTMGGVQVTLGAQNQLDIAFPVDTNGNHIADEWERGVNQGNLLPDITDRETGPPNSISLGDGLTAFDEYRGFFVIENGIEHHITTDPLNQKDVFYLNATGVTRDPAKSTIDFLNQVLGTQTRPGIVYHEVSARGASTVDNTLDGSHGVGRLNRNNSPGQADVYAIVYLNSTTLRGNIMGQAPTIGFTNQPVQISLAKIDAIDNDFSQQLRATTIAHETGHVFGLRHPTQIAQYSSVSDAGNPSSLPPGSYARKATDPTEFAAWLETAAFGGSRVILELPQAQVDDLTDTLPSDIATLTTWPFPHPSFPTKYFVIFQVPPGGLTAIPVQIQISTYTGHIMDGAAEVGSSGSQSTFSTSDISLMCVKTTCP
jgi:hypothetical protein